MMQYEFSKPFWLNEDEKGELKHEDREAMLEEAANAMRESIERLLESQENFLGKGMTAEVHFLEQDRKMCYKIMRKVEVLARPDAVENLSPEYRDIYERKKKADADPKTPKMPWHVDLFNEAGMLARARKVDPESPVKVPRPYGRMEIVGKEEGEGYEVIDKMEVLLMETMDAVSLDDFMRRGMLPKDGFDADAFFRQVSNFIHAMHEKRLYHRDLHAGNVMIERETNKPVIIDFGRGTVSAEEDAYMENVAPGDNLQFISDEQMFRTKAELPFKQYLEWRKLTPLAK